MDCGDGHGVGIINMRLPKAGAELGWSGAYCLGKIKTTVYNGARDRNIKVIDRPICKGAD